MGASTALDRATRRAPEPREARGSRGLALGKAARSALAGLFLLACCSERDAGPPLRGPATPLDPATIGTIEGVVRFDGTPPPSTELRLAGDPACAAAHPGPVDAGDVRVRDGRVENAFVYIESGLEGRVFERPSEAVTIDQQGCLYDPRVAGAQTGQTIELVNSDPTLHNVHLEPTKSRGMNFGMAVKGSRRSIHIDAPEVMIALRCDVHPWMRAHLGVLDHPYFAVTPADGTFRLASLPAGSYTLSAWHERFGTNRMKVTVAAKQTVTADPRFARASP